MILNTLILISAAVLFVIFVRRLPSGFWGDKVEDIREKMAIKDFGAKIFSVFGFLKKMKKPKTTVVDVSSDNEGMDSFDSFLSKEVQTIDEDKNKVDEDLSLEKADDLLKRGSVLLAQEIYLKLLDIEPENPKLHNRLGIIYLEQKDFNKAKDFFLSSLSSGENIPARQYNLALAYIGLNEYTLAQEVLKKALNADPSNQKYTDLLEEVRDKV
ncbi:MAG: hypothetical protein CEN91_497 [Candidatus Berkelbacteria bacterium Licking1014_85]|uniref:Uncharacterized protein n=1 Tax=Candidatus Berkelbacteria bacterium Licking1014_85 TaxID=2017148 RepID=A0A554LHC5_9BACT|nr:MAG: hypothetical protein CEN91_497 [Candidatus Berkelbacteria bacterium Licking1014_85]